MDFSFGMVEATRATGVAARFAQCDAQEIPFVSGCFDVVIANHVLYHVPDIPRALAGIRRVLKTGGTLYAATNGRNHMREIDELAGEFGVGAASARLSFTLEQGEELLTNDFSSIRRVDFKDGLVVTEVEPLLAYILSMFLARGLRGSQAESQLRQVIAGYIARNGAIRITRAAGLFIAGAD